MKIQVCQGTRCMMNGSLHLYDQLNSLNELILLNPDDYLVESVEATPRKCEKACKRDPKFKNVVVCIDGVCHEDMKNVEVLEYVMDKIKK